MNKLLILALSIVLTACGGGGAGMTQVQDTSDGGGAVTGTSDSYNAVRNATRPITAGAVCEFGGTAIDSGIDVNQNGVLDSDEVDETSTVCNGDDGYDSLINIVSEAAGGNCATGGVSITSGKDLDRSGTLETSEVTSTSYVCSGAVGTDGTTGADGTDGTDGTDGAAGGATGAAGADGTNGTDGINGTNGTNGTDNKAIASFYCGNNLVGATNIYWFYTAHLLSSGDLVVSGKIRNAEIEASNTNYYSASQVGASTAQVTISYDLVGTSNYGYWTIELNRSTLITTITYYDTELSSNPDVWVAPASECNVNNY
jgi:hypothetical protein